eukprot:Awhi_evm1s489
MKHTTTNSKTLLIVLVLISMMKESLALSINIEENTFQGISPKYHALQWSYVTGTLEDCSYVASVDDASFSHSNFIDTKTFGNPGICISNNNIFCSYTLSSLCVSEGQAFHENQSCEGQGFTEFNTLRVKDQNDAEIVLCSKSYTGHNMDNAIVHDDTESVCNQKGDLSLYNDHSFCADRSNTIKINTKVNGKDDEILLNSNNNQENVDFEEKSCSDLGYSHPLPMEIDGKLVTICVDDTLNKNTMVTDINPVKSLLEETVPLSLLESDTATCGVKPPSFGGCDLDCQLQNGIRSAALSAIGFIPDVGGSLKAIIGLFWGVNEGPSINDKLDQMVQYVQNLVKETKDDILSKLISNNYRSLGESFYTLQNYIDIKAGDAPALLEVMVKSCQDLKIALQDTSINPLKTLPYIAPVGQICATLLSQRAYHYEGISGVKPNEAAIESYKLDLKNTIDAFYNISKNAVTAASKWRMDEIQTTARDGSWPCGYTCNHHYGQVLDKGCKEIGAIPGNILENEDVCCHRPSAGKQKELKDWYSKLQKQIFRDNFLGKWGLNTFQLWKYMDPAMVDTKQVPKNVFETAVSPMMSYRGGFRFEQYSYTNNQADVDTLIKAAQSNPQETKLLKIEITKGDAVIGVRATTQIGDKIYTTTVGRWGRGDANWIVFDLSKKPNNILTGWAYHGSIDHCFQTQQITDNTQGTLGLKQFACEAGGKVDQIPYFTRPPITVNSTTTGTFVPRIIGISGIGSSHDLNIVTAVWLYEKLE